MKCPACDNGTLFNQEHLGISFTQCPDCQGVWLDRESLTSLQKTDRSLSEAGEGAGEFDAVKGLSACAGHCGRSCFNNIRKNNRTDSFPRGAATRSLPATILCKGNDFDTALSPTSGILEATKGGMTMWNDNLLQFAPGSKSGSTRPLRPAEVLRAPGPGGSGRAGSGLIRESFYRIVPRPSHDCDVTPLELSPQTKKGQRGK
jgi:hypothetical protein